MSVWTLAPRQVLLKVSLQIGCTHNLLATGWVWSQNKWVLGPGEEAMPMWTVIIRGPRNFIPDKDLHLTSDVAVNTKAGTRGKITDTYYNILLVSPSS